MRIIHGGHMATTNKQETMDQLAAFMHLFAYSVGRVYGSGAIPGLLGVEPGTFEMYATKPEKLDFSSTSLWQAVSDMYDFGIDGVPTADFGMTFPDSQYADAELFFQALQTPAMELYLQEDEAKLPRLAIRAVQTAVARHILEGGERYTDFEAMDGGGYGADHLSIKEMALLASMDERSVRNACNPKLPGALQTVQVGKRTMVTREEARRWLAGRKSYVPLKAEGEALELKQETLELPSDLVARLRKRAESKGVTLEAFIGQLVNSEGAQ